MSLITASCPDFTQIITTDGRSLSEVVYLSFETLFYADLDFNELYYAKMIVDPVGQYMRPGLFRLHVTSLINRHCFYDSEEQIGFDDASRFSYLES